jgi:hypothetical protein
VLIEHKITFENDCLTITQRIQAGGSTAQIKQDAPLAQKLLAKTHAESLATFAAQPATQPPPAGGAGDNPGDTGGPGDNPGDTGGPGDNPSDTGGPNAGTAPITLIGPIVLCCRCPKVKDEDADAKPSEKEK